MPIPRRRLEPCDILRQHGIPCLVWFEDAIAAYGVPTVGFDLHILVPQIDEAAKVLVDNGWSSTKHEYGYHFMKELPSTAYRRLDPNREVNEALDTWPPPLPTKDPPGPCVTILLPATDWKLPLEI